MAYFPRVAADTEVAYELVAEPIQEPQAGEPQADEAAEQVTEEIANPTDLQGKPWSITPTLNTYAMYYLSTYALSSRSYLEP